MPGEIVLPLRGALLFLYLAAAAAPAPARGAVDPANPDWPCIQRKVPEISAGMVWAGPEVQENGRAWKESLRLAELTAKISARRLPIEEAQNEIDRFATDLGRDKNEQLTLLFTGVLQIINAERSEIVAGIERYARRQGALASRIRAATAELNTLRKKQNRSEADAAEIKALEERLLWDTRVFDERQQSLSYVCESPVLLEQRLFALSRRIMSQKSSVAQSPQPVP